MDIKLTNLQYTYRKGHTRAIDSINAQIGPGIHLLLGENGAGKTTLLHLIDGLLKPTQGECRVDEGKTCLRLPSLMSHMIFLGPTTQFPALTINEMSRIHAQFYPNFSPEMLTENMANFGMTGNEKLKNLSMGNRQKAAVAYVLSLRTGIILLDEPATGLDIESKQALQQMIARCVEPDQTVIISTHNISDLRNLYDGVIVLSHGKLLLADTTDSILERISFTVTPDKPADAFYCEPRLDRFHSIVPNRNNDISSDIDYRLLYMALHQNDNSELRQTLNNEIS